MHCIIQIKFPQKNDDIKIEKLGKDSKTTLLVGFYCFVLSVETSAANNNQKLKS